ncbi:MAG: CBS domain-containing protein [Ardenticatenaceae bacterium]|nr:CBS domain-containing protein [Ardenticatenaceae bacterium]HBY94814.1 hypothetical protein [Chloroflexota bacterium]
MHHSLVQDWMTPNPITMSPETSLHEASNLMKQHNIRRLPVVAKGRLVGIVTWGDVREASPSDATSLSIWELHYLLVKLRIDDIMSKEVLTVRPEQTIQEAARVMLQHKISGLPVVEDGQVVGIITESDIFRLVVQEWEREVEPALVEGPMR